MKMFRLLRADEIDCRISQIDDTGLALLLYKDARCDMNILDETVGPMNWEREHSRDNANCTVSIWDKEREFWVAKEDTGTESNTEAEKGLASDSFKRACVNWGIGRELYTSPRIWIPAAKCNMKTGRNGKPACYDKFRVIKIEYQDEQISTLVIANEKTRQIAFEWFTDKLPAEEPKTQENADTSEPVDPAYVCADCGKKILPFKDAKGKYVNLRSYESRSQKLFGKLLCPDCASKAKS